MLSVCGQFMRKARTQQLMNLLADQHTCPRNKHSRIHKNRWWLAGDTWVFSAAMTLMSGVMLSLGRACLPSTLLQNRREWKKNRVLLCLSR